LSTPPVLLDLHGEPVAREHAVLIIGLGAHGEDAAVDPHVAHLHLVGHAAQGDDGPVLELEGGDGAEFLDRPRQIADDERVDIVGAVPRLALAHLADIAEAFGHDAAGGGRDVDADPLPPEVLGSDQGCAAAAEGVADDVVGVAAGVDDAVEEDKGTVSAQPRKSTLPS